MEIAFPKHDKHTVIMILCFIYGGVALLYFITQLAMAVQFSLQPPPEGGIDWFMNASDIRMPLDNTTFRRRPPGPGMNTTRYIDMLLSFFGATVSILAGFSLMALLKRKEHKKLTKSVIDTMTTPEEKLIIEELEENEGELSQSELVRRTKLSKVKVHRIIKRLESLKVVSKYPYGMTNKIKLERSVYKEKAE